MNKAVNNKNTEVSTTTGVSTSTSVASTTTRKRAPAKTILVGDVSASIWAREHQFKNGAKTFYSVTFERSYKDSDKEYQYTKNFDFESLKRLGTAVQEAHEYLNNLINPATMLPAEESQVSK